jgi:hypothetical protein
MTRLWAIYRAPEGAPAPYMVAAWDTEPGGKPSRSEPVFAASLEQAREVVPAGLERSDPSTSTAEARRLIETWEARTE